MASEEEPGLTRRVVLKASSLAFLGAALAEIGVIAVAEPAFANGAWGGYQNGRIPLSALRVVSYTGVTPYQYSSAALDKVYLAPGADTRLLSLLKAYHAETGGYLKVSEGYRTYEGQVWLAANDNGTTPGTSNHGWGQAVDFHSGSITNSQVTWLANHGDAYGFYPLSGDRGHYNYTGPITPDTGSNMAVFIKTTSTSFWLVEEFSITHITDPDVASMYSAIYGHSITAPGHMLLAVKAAVEANRQAMISDLASAIAAQQPVP